MLLVLGILFKRVVTGKPKQEEAPPAQNINIQLQQPGVSYPGYSTTQPMAPGVPMMAPGVPMMAPGVPMQPQVVQAQGVYVSGQPPVAQAQYV